VKFSGRVTSADDVPLARGTVAIVGPAGVVGRGVVSAGKFSLSAEPSAVWGLTIDDRPVACLVASFDEAGVDLGEIVLFSQGAPMALFHAKGGLVFGAPLSLMTGARALGAAAAPAAAPLPTKAGVTFGKLVGDVALQLGALPSTKTGFSLQDAKVSIKGVPTTTEGAVGLEFPSEGVAATGIGLSELAFTLKPRESTTETQPTTKPTIAVPDLTSYTRDLAARKLQQVGLLVDTVAQAVRTPNDVGRILQQSPAGGALVPVGTVVRLFVGKRGAF